MSVAGPINAKQQEILNGFNGLRNEQRNLASKISELQVDLNEHKLVLETLKGVENDRKCFRMVGGILVQRTVGEIVPALASNADKMEKLITTIEGQLTSKGREITDYMEKHNIKVQGANETGSEKKGEDKKESEDSAKSSGVLVQ